MQGSSGIYCKEPILRGSTVLALFSTLRNRAVNSIDEVNAALKLSSGDEEICSK